MKRIVTLLLALIMLLSLVACGKKPTTNGDKTADGQNATDGTNTTTATKGYSYEDDWATYTYVKDTGAFDVTDLDTGTGMAGTSASITDNDDLINPEKFSGKKLQIYGYASSFYEDIDNFDGKFYFMVRAAADEWAYLNGVELDYVSGYDQSVILGDIHAGGKPDVLIYCNKFPLPALTGITRAFTAEEYAELAKTCGSYYLDMCNYKGESYGVVAPWSGGTVCYYNRTVFEEAGVKSPGEYFMEDNWTWDTFEECITEITEDTDGDGVIDIYGSGCVMFLIPQPMYRHLNDDGKLESLMRNSEEVMRYLEIYYRACTETKASGKYAAAYIATTPRPAISLGDGEWYNYAHMNQELVNGDIVEAIPAPKFDKDADQYYAHTIVYSSIMQSCDESEAALSMINYILRVGMRYISDYSLGLYKCNYEGIRGASPYSFGWKQKFQEMVAERQEEFNEKEAVWDQELYQKAQDAFLNADVHYINMEFPKQDGNGVYNNEASQMPPASSLPKIATREEAWMQVYNEQYAN